MIMQYIITGVILLLALAYAVWKIVKYFSKPKPASSACEKFSGDCAGCKAHYAEANKNLQECDQS